MYKFKFTAPEILVKDTGNNFTNKTVEGALLELATKNGSGGTVGDSSITTVKLADSAVTNTKIANAAVTVGKIADGAVTMGKIAYNSLIPPHFMSGSVMNDAIADNAVTTAKIANGSVTVEKADITSWDARYTKLGNASIRQVYALPTSGIENELVFKLPEQTLYIYTLGATEYDPAYWQPIMSDAVRKISATMLSAETTKNITHNLGDSFVTVTAYDEVTLKQVQLDVTAIDQNTVNVSRAVAGNPLRLHIMV